MCNFVSHCLALEQREVRGTSWQDVIAMADADKHISNKLLREKRPGVFPVTPKEATEF